MSRTIDEEKTQAGRKRSGQRRVIDCQQRQGLAKKKPINKHIVG